MNKLLLLPLVLSGCVSMQEVSELIHGTGDKTSQIFIDSIGQTEVTGRGFKIVTLSEESQTTVLENKGRYLAGLTASNQNKFTYTFEDGAIPLNGDFLIDNTRRAEMMEHISDNQVRVLEQFAPGIMAALEAGIGPFFEFMQTRQETRAATGLGGKVDPVVELLRGIFK